MSIEFLIYLLIAGAFGGFMAGLLGVGGGIVFVPIITFYLHQHIPDNELFSAIIMANSFFVILAIGFFGTFRQIRLGNFYPKMILATAIPAIVFSLVTSEFFVNTAFYSKKKFAYIFISLMLFVLYRFVGQALKQKKNQEEEREFEGVSTLKCVVPGVMTGVLSAISGLGGGIVMIPYFTQVLKIPVRTASAISLSVISIGAIPLVIYYLFKDGALLQTDVIHTGFIIWELVIPLTIGSIFTVGLGVRMAQKASPFVLFFLLSAFVLFTIIKLLTDLAMSGF